MSLEAEDRECAKGRTAPRVSLDDIKAAISEVHWRTGSECVAPQDTGPLSVLTIAFVVMRNGFTVIGKAAPASPENFNRELGRKLAYDDAVRQIWPLMGYALRDKLAGQ